MLRIHTTYESLNDEMIQMKSEPLIIGCLNTER